MCTAAGFGMSASKVGHVDKSNSHKYKQGYYVSIILELNDIWANIEWIEKIVGKRTNKTNPHLLDLNLQHKRQPKKNNFYDRNVVYYTLSNLNMVK